MFAVLKKQLQIAFIIILVIALLGGGVWAYFFFTQNREGVKEDRVNVRIDKTTIIEKVQSLQNLETVKQVIQRDFEIELASSDLNLFGVTLLESNRTQQFAVTGSVSAGVDLSGITEEDIELDSEANKVSLTLPSPTISNVSLMEDKIYLINDRSSFLFNVQNINQDVNRARNEELQKQLIKRGNQAMVDGACNNDILGIANENAETSLENLFVLIVDDQIEVEILTTAPGDCGFEIEE
jgi:anionic cell wall polymer biosynthesis LytR-Cps2A-Psr (LCP) family protein